jgi:pseudouridine-5'-phosphate glycosidase
MSEVVKNRLRVLVNHVVSKPLQYVSYASSSSKSVPLSLPESISFYVHPDVRQALQNNGPVVALESTIISHGMPYPQNVETAIRVENQVRKNGAIPATIAILDGVIHIGLDEAQLQKLGQLGQKCIKTSRRDIAAVCAKKGNGATTVSATMILANMFGIHVFVTGGIGGVHRGVEETMDISADLTELGKTPVCVVCAGVKSILDIPRTLEYLETNGVTVASYGTDEFPAFFTSKSGCKAQTRFDDPTECAKTLLANLELNLGSGMVIGVPIPKSEEAKATIVNKAIEKALNELQKKKISGKDATPFLLARVNELTKGESLKAST